MISRVWHGWTTLENADAYEGLLKSEIFQDIQSRQIAGYRRPHLRGGGCGPQGGAECNLQRGQHRRR